MTVEGMVVDGRVELDTPVQLPNGTRVSLELNGPRTKGPHPEDRETELEYMLESFEDLEAGRLYPAREVLRDIALRHHLPLEPGE